MLINFNLGQDWPLIIIGLLLCFITGFLVRLMFINQKTFGLLLALLLGESLLGVFLVFARQFWQRYPLLQTIMIGIMIILLPIMTFQIMLPDLRKHLEAKALGHMLKNRSHSSEGPSIKNKEIIAEAIFELSAKKIGALITIEKYNSLEHFAERAISINADISKELIHNIFIPNTPLHDGAVIVRDDKLICAGAYFNLTKNMSYEKTTGSRHRAALGVSEISDSLTIVASEETGDVSVAYGGVLIPIADKAALVNYLESFVK